MLTNKNEKKKWEQEECNCMKCNKSTWRLNTFDENC